ncbi:MAG: AbrB/MazE/SpoVT family DNA-binding domain-containing protein [Minisyncoccales bacterium]
MALKTRLRKWGNSIGLVIPNEILKQKNLKQGEEIIIEIEKQNPLKNIFGSLKEWNIDTQRIKDKIRAQESK